MTTKEVADKLVSLCREGKFDEAYGLYADDVVSLEQEGGNWPPRLEGKAAVLGKAAQFNQMTESMHSITVSDPLIADNHFCCKMVMDMTMKGMGRSTNEELCVYQVRDGEIVKEEFFYANPS